MTFTMGEPTDDEIGTLVSARRAGAVSDDLVLSLLSSTVERFERNSTDDQGGDWNLAAWRKGFLAIPAVSRFCESFDVLDQRLTKDGVSSPTRVTVSRRDVFAQRDDPTRLFLTAMAWGYGLTGYGWLRTARVLEKAGADGIGDVIASMREFAQQGPEVAFQAWSRGGVAKLPGLGTAFASKLAYFSTYDRDRASGLLIADIYTAWSMWALVDLWDIRRVPTLYADYVRHAELWAKTLGCRSDDIERALFLIGRPVRKKCKTPNTP